MCPLYSASVCRLRARSNPFAAAITILVVTGPPLLWTVVKYNWSLVSTSSPSKSPLPRFFYGSIDMELASFSLLLLLVTSLWKAFRIDFTVVGCTGCFNFLEKYQAAAATPWTFAYFPICALCFEVYLHFCKTVVIPIFNVRCAIDTMNVCTMIKLINTSIIYIY